MRELPIGPNEIRSLSATLRKVDFFADLSMRDLERVFAVTKLYATEKRRTVIFKKGQVGDALYLIHSGTVRIVMPRFLRPARTLATLGAGDFFGEMALLKQPFRTATAIADGSAELFVLLTPNFNDILRQNPDFAHALNAVAAQRAFDLKNRAG